MWSGSARVCCFSLFPLDVRAVCAGAKGVGGERVYTVVGAGGGDDCYCVVCELWDRGRGGLKPCGARCAGWRPRGKCLWCHHRS